VTGNIPKKPSVVAILALPIGQTVKAKTLNNNQAIQITR